MWIDVFFGNIRVEIRWLDKPKKKFVNNLKVRPCKFEYGFILFGIESVTYGIYLWRYGSKKIDSKLANHVYVRLLSNKSSKYRNSYSDLNKYLFIYIEKIWQTIETTSGYIGSVITPRFVVIYSKSSASVDLLISFPLRSALASLKSKITEHWLSFLRKSSCLLSGKTSDNFIERGLL